MASYNPRIQSNGDVDVPNRLDFGGCSLTLDANWAVQLSKIANMEITRTIFGKVSK